MENTKSTRPVVKIDNLNALFNLTEATEEISSKEEQKSLEPIKSSVSTLPIDKLTGFKNHPFKLYEGERQKDMVESIQKHGILIPLIVRPIEKNMYEMLSGHNRKLCATLAGLSEVPVIIKENLSDEEALVYVIESNIIQRSFSELLHSEKASILSMQHSKLFSQGKRNDIIATLKALENPDAPYMDSGSEQNQKLKSRELIAKEYGLSKDMVARYLRIEKLLPSIKEKLDAGKIAFIPAVTLSFLKTKEQELLNKCIELNDFKVSMKKANLLRTYSEKGKLNEDAIYLILNGDIGHKSKNKTQTHKMKLSSEMLSKYFSPEQNKKEIEKTVIKALEFYFKNYPKQENKQIEDYIQEEEHCL